MAYRVPPGSDGWEVRTARKLLHLEGEMPVFSPDGRLLAVAELRLPPNI
jgi:hypothetical protein